MNKQFQGSKKKSRRKQFAERESKRRQDRLRSLKYTEAVNSGNIEEMANAMGIKLK